MLKDFEAHVFPNENFIDLDMYQFGHEKCKPGHSFGPAARQHFLFHYIIRGKGILIDHDLRNLTPSYEIGENQGFLLKPGQLTTYIADASEPWEYMWIEFDGMRARGLMDIAGLTGKNPVFTAKFTEYLPEIKEHMYYILNHEDEDTVCLIGHLYLFLHALIRSVNEKGYRPQRNKLVDFYMREATAFIDNNYEKDISVQDIARNCGLDRSYFGKIFKEAMGYTPQEFLLSFRISKAQDLLKNSPMSVGEISHAVGYENQLHFSRAFAKFCGMSPTAWRKSNVR